MSDYREKYILHEGDSIEIGERKFVITGEPLGFGGSAVVYPAKQEGRELNFAIKECFPNRNGFERRNGIVQPQDSEDITAKSALENYKGMFSVEQSMGEQLRNKSLIRFLSAWETVHPTAVTYKGDRFTDTEDGIYSILDRVDSEKGLFFREILDQIGPDTGKLPSVYFTACLMEQVLSTLKKVHDKGFLYGDISEGNLFFAECVPGKNPGTCMFIDFGSTKKFVDGKIKEEIYSSDIYSTNGFKPPECHETGPLNGLHSILLRSNQKEVAPKGTTSYLGDAYAILKS